MQESNSKDFTRLFEILEEVFNGKDPLDFQEEVDKMNFPMKIDDTMIFLCTAQLFMAEQDINYSDGKVQPPRAYLMGYLRFISTKEQNIDKILWSSIRHPPRQEFWKNWKTS